MVLGEAERHRILALVGCRDLEAVDALEPIAPFVEELGIGRQIRNLVRHDWRSAMRQFDAVIYSPATRVEEMSVPLML